nr:MAG TPA: hypothetical protein [Caudoviricetes sp.]
MYSYIPPFTLLTFYLDENFVNFAFILFILLS